jgi:hypothetical protein
MKTPRALRVVRVLIVSVLAWGLTGFATIPLPEHPRPDFERADWLNLNGEWAFQFDPGDEGQTAGWARAGFPFQTRILVPFPWGSRLSGVENQGDIAWYRRTLQVPEEWRGKRVFVVVGASDWVTRGWLDGEPLGDHRGGYTPFEFELTPHVTWGQEQSLVFRVDDTPHPFKLEGKQGYGPAKGIWQTVYLEARPALHVQALRFTPEVDRRQVSVVAELNTAAPEAAELRLRFQSGGVPEAAVTVPRGAREVRLEVPIPQPHLWSLDDPFLYEVVASLKSPGGEDRVASYFGMRTISVEKLPGTEIPYVALNGQPVYLQMALDQSYHPDGYYTFPSDAFMRDEILRSKQIGLNGNRIHIKVEVPRKLYWADKLGLLIMADVPNAWGEPTPEARRETEFALRGMIARDFNHPSIFSWVVFNETWGLFTAQPDGKKVYLPETQEWVVSMYRLAKSLDPTRLVEDNSPCHHDHTETDLNTWHDYLPGYAWKDRLEQISRDTFPGSTWNFIGGRRQGAQPMFNSECGNVWGYEGSAGDVDWSWDYHLMLNEFRRHPKVAGWLYTEHHDVINEWNGYYRYDRSEKFTGLEDFVPGMTLKDLHGPYYLSTGSELCRDAKPGETVDVPMFASFMTGQAPGDRLVVRTELYGWNDLGQRETYSHGSRPLEFEPWLNRELPPLRVSLPSKPALAVLALTLESEAGVVLHRNFTTFLVGDGTAPREEGREVDGKGLHLVRFAPSSFTAAEWSQKQWNVLEGLKVNGAGHGYFEYRLPWPAGLDPTSVAGATVVVEASAKVLFGKDREGAVVEGDFMRGKGTHDPSANPNAYPMTDTVRHPSAVRIQLNGVTAAAVTLPDDPADHRGVLSWHAQLRDRRLREAGSYGYLIEAVVPPEALERAAREKSLVLRFSVDSALPGGLAIYGARFGRYPLDPTIIFHRR